MRVARLITNDDLPPLFVRGNPSKEAVCEFVAEQNRRFEAGEPGGPGGGAAREIVKAEFFNHEHDGWDEKAKGKPIDIRKYLVKGN